jgi:hypothetical protein
MKNKLTLIILICIIVCFLLFNAGLLLLHQMDEIELHLANHRLEYLEGVEFKFMASKEVTATRFKYEQRSIGNVYIYSGSNNNVLIPVQSVAEQPKLVLGLNQNMCRPCVEGVFNDVKEFFSDF